MWVLIKETYAGPLGFYPGGLKQNLDKDAIAGLRKQLGKKNVIDTCAPEDEHKDIKAIEAAEMKAQANNAIYAAVALRAKAEQCLGTELQFKKEHVAAGELCVQSRQQVNAATQNSDSPDLTKLSRNQKTNVAALHIAYGRLEIAVGEAILAEIEAQDAERKATELAKAAGIDWPKKG